MFTPVEWRQPKALHRYYQLLNNAREVGALRFENSGSRATGEYAGRKWTFQRTGFLKPRILVREESAETDLAEFTPNWNGRGQVTFASGARYSFKPTNFWLSEWAFEAPDGSALVVLDGPSGILHQTGAAKIAESFAASPDAQMLLVLIWYVRLLIREDAAKTATG